MEINLAEIQTIRAALDVITITGKDAIFIANLQTKLSNEITRLQSTTQNLPNDKPVSAVQKSNSKK
jgi:hypothetical protein